MKRIAVFICAVITFGCTQKTIDTKTEADKVLQLSKEWSSVASTGDVAKTVSYWADDAVMISAGHPVLEGKESIKKMVEESFRIPGFRISWDPQKAVVSKSGDMAYILEDSQVSFSDSTGKSIILKNKAVSIWRKQADGSWKNVVDISTPTSPSAP